MSKVTESNGIRREESKGSLVLDKIYKADFQKAGTLTAQIRQEVTTKSFYPAKKVASNLQANVFALSDFGFEGKEFTSVEHRVAWIPVPEGATMDVVKGKLEAAVKNGATIYRVLSNNPILSDDQKYAITQGFKTMDDFANSQVARYPDNEETRAEGTAGKLVLDKAGNVQYRRTFFWGTPIEDQDVRTGTNVYMTPEIMAELKGASVLEGQTL